VEKVGNPQKKRGGESWPFGRVSLSGSMDQVAVELTALLGWLRTFNLSSEVSTS